jgi:glucokinase
MILAGDIGGTKTSIALFEDNLRIIEGSQQKFVSKDNTSLWQIIQQYAHVHLQCHDVTMAGFGIAGPVKDGVCVPPNLPTWEPVSAADLAKKLNVKHVALANDLVANAAGIDVLPSGSIDKITDGAIGAHGNRAIISAGTGLGQGSIIWDEHDRKYHPVPSEGGHSEFAPRSELEVELWRYLTQKFGRAEWEHVLSGPGLYNIYVFLRDVKKREEPESLAKDIAAMDKSAAVSIAAIKGNVPIATEAMNMFVSFYGAQAGNVALNVVATGGVFIGGGIAPKILAKLKSSAFIDAFLAKGPMRKLMEGIPVHVILNQDTALYGAAALARG